MLASIQTIKSVESIPGADRIEKVKVLGWDCIVKKGTFNPGDLCIYIEIDTLIPTCFLSEKFEDRDKYIRLKTIKMKGQLSQGLVLPLEGLGTGLLYMTGQHTCDDELDGHIDFILSRKEGDDVTEELMVKKYEKAIPPQLQGIAKGNFPSFISKTDEVRVQSEPELLQKLIGKPYYITVKIDGTSSTFYKNPTLGVCSRNLELKDPDKPVYFDVNVYWKMAIKYELEKRIPEGIAIQGEIAGPGIQDNKLGLSDFQLFVFNVYDIVDHEYFCYNDMQAFLKAKGLEMVPVVEHGESFNYTFEQLMEMSDNLNYSNGGKAEGIVVRSMDQSISFKVVSNKFLLKNGE